VSLWVWSTEENANEVRDRIVPAGTEPSLVSEWSTGGDGEHIYFGLSKLDYSASFFKDAVLPLVLDERFARSGDWFYENAALKFFGVIAVTDHACDYPPGAWGDDAVRFLGSYSYDSTASRIGECLGEDPATVAIWVDLNLDMFEPERLLGYWDPDRMEATETAEPLPVHDQLSRFSYSSTFITKAVENAESLRVKTVKTTFLLYDHSYDAVPGPMGSGTFLGNFPFEKTRR